MMDNIQYLTSENKKKAKSLIRQEILTLLKNQPAGLTQLELIDQLQELGKNHSLRTGSSLFRYHLQPLAIEGKIFARGKDSTRKWYIKEKSE